MTDDSERDPRGPQTHAQSTRERRDVVSGDVMPEERLIRFVAGPMERWSRPGAASCRPRFWVEATR
jgi:hypothetical protein